MALDEKQTKKLLNLCTKISNVFTDFYILKHGYIMSVEKDKPFIIQIDNECVELFAGVCGDFKISHIWNVREFKKDMENYITIVSSASESTRVFNLLTERIKSINTCIDWENFTLSDNEEDNQKLLLSLFKNNDYINFKPKNIDGPEIILTKSLLPIVSEKNYTNLYYSTKKINSNLFLIVFDFQFDLFRLYMLHYYIPIDEGDNNEE
jgi:hypothetical protein